MSLKVLLVVALLQVSVGYGFKLELFDEQSFEGKKR